jgi:hypothetical protein
MSWTKLSDGYADETWELSDAAYRLHTDGLIWSNRRLLDLVIPKDDVRRFAKTPGAVRELLEGGFWEDMGSVYVILHHAEHQRRKESVIARQEANAANGRKGGRPPKGQTASRSSVVNRLTEANALINRAVSDLR